MADQASASNGAPAGAAGGVAASSDTSPSSSANQGQADTPPAGPAEISLDEYGDRVVKFTIDGEEVSMPLRDALSRASHGHVASQRLREAAQAKRQADAIAQHVQTLIEGLASPQGWREAAQWLRQHGGRDAPDMVSAAREILREEMELQKLTPEQRERYQIAAERRQLEEYREAIERQREDAERAHRDKEIGSRAQVERENYARAFGAALKERGLPVSRRTIAQMAQLAEESIEVGIDPDPRWLAERLEQEHQEELGELAGLEGDALLRRVPEAVLAKIRAADLARVKAAVPGPVQPPPKPAAKPAERPVRRIMDADDLRELRRSRG